MSGACRRARLVLLPWSCREIGGTGSTGRAEDLPLERSACDLTYRPLKSVGEASELLEETINRVRRGPFDLRSANSIGFLASTLLRALDQRLEDRVAHLEAVLSRKGGNNSETFEFLPGKGIEA
jgi:hypothetical protein